MVWEQLEKMGLKPKRKEKTKIEERKEEIEKFLEKIKSDENKRKILALLIESFSEEDPKEILVYGMYVKKNLASFVPASKDKRLEKTLEWLEKAIEEFMKHAK